MRFAYLIEPPFNYRTAYGEVTGSDVELARLAMSSVGHGDVEMVEAEFAELLPGLEAGRWDMTTGLFITAERQALAAFSLPVWSLVDGLLISDTNALRIADLRSFAAGSGFRLAVIAGQVQYETARTAGVPLSNIDLFSTYAAAADAVASGDVAGYLSVALAHRGYIKESGASGLRVVELPSEQSARAVGAFGFRKQDADLRERMNGFLAGFIGSPQHLTLLDRFDMRGALP